MPRTRTRVVGSGFTTFNYRGKPIAFLDGFSDSGQTPLGGGSEAIIPLDAPYPVEIATGRAMGAGLLTVTIKELWDAPVWHQLSGLEGTNTIIDVFTRIAAEPGEVTCQMLIQIPGSTVWRGKTYHGCVVTRIDDGETVTIGALTIPRTLDIAYTHFLPFVINAGTA
jgi:hypothetical protein